MGGVTDPVLLVAAVLHDTIEDTETTSEELEEHFGDAVRSVVEEVTDDKTLPKEVRKRLQIQHAPRASDRAKQVKLADKICNVVDVTRSPPPDWSRVRKRAYLEWSEQVVAGCRGVNLELEDYFDRAMIVGRAALNVPTVRQGFRDNQWLKMRMRPGTVLETNDFAYLQVLEVHDDGVFARTGASARSHFNWYFLTQYDVRIYSQPEDTGTPAAPPLPRAVRRGGPLDRSASVEPDSQDTSALEQVLATALLGTIAGRGGRWTISASSGSTKSDTLAVELHTSGGTVTTVDSAEVLTLAGRHRAAIEAAHVAPWSQMVVVTEPVGDGSWRYEVKFQYD